MSCESGWTDIIKEIGDILFAASHQGEALVTILSRLLSRDRPDEIQLGAAKWLVSI